MSGFVTPALLRQVYIPSALLVITAAVTKKELIPFALAISGALGAYVFMQRPVPCLNKDSYQDFKLDKKTSVSPNTSIYRFKLPKANNVLGLPTGQHITVGALVDGEDVSRSYTPITSDAEDHGYFDLLIKAYPTGRISRHVDQLKIGDSIKVKGPKGQMIYQPNMVKRIGMIAGGSGITPMLQIARTIHRGRFPLIGDNTKVDMIYANVNEEDILQRQEIDELAKSDDRFSIYYVLNNAPQGWKGGVGFVSPEMIKEHLPSPAKDTQILICGPPPMVSAMKKATEALGFDKARPVSKVNDQVFCF